MDRLTVLVMALLFSSPPPGDLAGGLVPLGQGSPPVRARSSVLPSMTVSRMAGSAQNAAVGVMHLTGLLQALHHRRQSTPDGKLEPLVWLWGGANDRPVAAEVAAPVFLTGVLVAFGDDASLWDDAVLMLVVEVLGWLDDSSFDSALPVGLVCGAAGSKEGSSADLWHVDALPCRRLRGRLDRLATGSLSRRAEMTQLLANWHGSFAEFACAVRMLGL